MRTGPNNRRPRSRGNANRRHSSVRGQNFESKGPESKVRGNAQQLVEKYLQLSRDANNSGDRVTAENFSQHAEHYYRMHAANNAAPDARQSDQSNQSSRAGSQDRGGNGAERGPNVRRNRGDDGSNTGNGKESGAEAAGKAEPAADKAEPAAEPAAGKAEPGSPQPAIPGADPS
jgi:hypothetical protein